MRRIVALSTAIGMVVALLPGVATADDEVDYTPIYEIQGDGDASPLVDEEVTTEGVVTVDLQLTEEIRGFFLQDRRGDGDPSTSDGIFVFHQDTWGWDVSVGDRLRVTGTVSEFFGDTQLGDITDIQTIGRARIRPTQIDPRTFNENPEQYEGMLVRFPGRLTVTDTFNLARFGEVWLSDGGVVEQPTNEFPAGSPEMHAMALDGIARSILLDDGSRFSNPDEVPHLNRVGTLRLGDITNNLTGAINFSFGQYRLQPQDDVRFANANKRPRPPRIDGDVVVASFNVLNYWTTLGGRGAATQESLDVQTDKLVSAIRLMGADIVGLQELENPASCGDGDDGTPCDSTPILTLLAALNAAEGADVWSWMGELDYYNGYPIRNEIIYRNDKVDAIGGPVTIQDDVFDRLRDPDDPTSGVGRPPVAQTFSVDGDVFTVMVNHLKSKGSSSATGDDLDQGDGQAAYNATRVAQAERVLEFVDELIASTGDPDVLVIGDFNSYAKEDPIVTLGGGLENLVDGYVDNPYSFNFFASFAAPFIGRGTLENAFATDGLADGVEEVEFWHINADEPRFLDWFDPTTVAPGPYRSSDHDPLLIGLDLGHGDHDHDGHNHDAKDHDDGE